MSKFCMQCGAQIDDNAEICQSCGANQNNVSANASVAEVNDKSAKTTPILIAAAAVVIVIVLLIFKALFGGSYKDPIDNFCKAMETGKGKYLYKCMPEFMIEYEYEDMKKSEILDELDDIGKDILDDLEDDYGDDIKVTYKIKNKEKIDKDDLEDMEHDIKKYYDSKVKIKKGYEVEVRLKIKGDDESDSQKMNLKIYKIDGDWCMDVDHLL